jgi:hypothetical protein
LAIQDRGQEEKGEEKKNGRVKKNAPLIDVSHALDGDKKEHRKGAVVDSDLPDSIQHVCKWLLASAEFKKYQPDSLKLVGMDEQRNVYTCECGGDKVVICEEEDSDCDDGYDDDEDEQEKNCTRSTTYSRATDSLFQPKSNDGKEY